MTTTSNDFDPLAFLETPAEPMPKDKPSPPPQDSLSSGNQQIPNEEVQHLAQRKTADETAMVGLSLSLKRNIGNYEDVHYSIRLDQHCAPADKARTLAELEAMAVKWITSKSQGVDAMLRNRERAQHGQGQNR